MVDTLFSIGKIYKKQTLASIEALPHGRVFHYLMRDSLQSIQERIPDLQPIEVAYLCKGLTNLRKIHNGRN